MNTVFLLLAEFGQADIPLETVVAKYLGLGRREACLKAYSCELPFLAFHAGTQRSPWMVRVTDLAAWLDKARADAVSEWEKVNGRTFPAAHADTSNRLTPRIPRR